MFYVLSPGPTLFIVTSKLDRFGVATQGYLASQVGTTTVTARPVMESNYSQSPHDMPGVVGGYNVQAWRCLKPGGLMIISFATKNKATEDR